MKKKNKEIAALKKKVEKLENQDKNKPISYDLNEYLKATDHFFQRKPDLATFIKTQITEFLKPNPKGRRYSTRFKKIALLMFYSGPQAYRLNSKLFCLPHPRTLERRIECLEFPPGLHDIVIEYFKIKTKSLKDLEKICTLSIYEASIKANLSYSIKNDEVISLEDLGEETKSLKPACYLSVLMVKGVFKKFEKPIGYYFVHTAIDATFLKNAIIHAIKKLQEIGLDIITLSSDMGSNFLSLAKLLGATAQSPYFMVNNKKVFVLFDPPHGLKAVRNNFSKNIIHADSSIIAPVFTEQQQPPPQDNYISYEHVENLYVNDSQNANRLTKLTETHVYPNNFQKMKVKYAAQLLSQRVAAAMMTAIINNILPVSALCTVLFIYCMDTLFDLFNSDSLKHPKIYKQAYVNAEYQTNFLNIAKQYLGTIKLFNRNTFQDVTNRVKCFKCWIHNINSSRDLWDYLQTNYVGIKFLFMRRFCTASLEHFFAKLRNVRGNSFNSTTMQCYQSFRKLFVIGQDLPDLNNDKCTVRSTVHDEMLTEFIDRNGELLQNLHTQQNLRVVNDVTV